MRAAPVYLLLPELLQPRNFPGSPIGLPGGGRHRNRVHNCARSSPMLPGSAEAHSGNTGVVFVFPCQFFAAPGGLGWCSSVPGIALWLGALKDKKHAGGQKPPTCFGTSCASGAMGLVWGRRGVINETVINEEAAENCFHVPATSSEALSTNGQCCRDMEALFSVFHTLAMWVWGCYGDAVVVGVAVWWCHGRVGHRVAVGLLPEYTRIKKTL